VDGGVQVNSGTITSSEIAGDGPVTLTSFAEATGETGQYTFGPAEAPIVAGDADAFASTTASFGGTDTNTILGASGNGLPL
jgi:hypothetical protein